MVLCGVTHQRAAPESWMTEDRVTVYTPESPLRHPARLAREMVADLSASRELARRLFLRDLRAQYRHSVLGYLWVIAPPLLASVPFIYLNSSGVMRMADTPIPYAAFAVVGTVIWQTFVDGLNSPLRVMNAARAMLTRISFPREAILLSGLMQVGFSFLVRLVLLAAVLAAFSLPVRATAPLFVIGMVSVALTGFAIGVVLTPARPSLRRRATGAAAREHVSHVPDARAVPGTRVRDWCDDRRDQSPHTLGDHDA